MYILIYSKCPKKKLNYTCNKGLTEGITTAIIENMSKLSLYERPLHCTDVKRETLLNN